MKRYKVAFEIQGELLADCVSLNKKNLKELIKRDLDAKKALKYEGNRDIDTIVENLKIEEKKISLPF